MRYIVFAILILIGKSIYAQGDSYKLNIGLQPGYGFAWAHDKQVSAIENTSASSLTFEINKLHLGPLAELWHKNGYYNGFQFAYFHFSNSIIGQALSASYFIEPILLKNKQFTLSARGCLGLMYASHPFDSVGNPLNRNYSLYINPYLALSLIANYHFYDRYSLKAAVNYNHISNGNIQDPNYGLNFPTINLGIEKNISQKSHKTKAIDTTKCWRFDIVGFASNKSSTLSLNDRFWVYGFDINASRKINFKHALTGGIEYMSDESVGFLYQCESRKGLSIYRVGTTIGHEFLFGPRFIFSQQLGLYVFNQTPYVSWVYHRWGLQYKLNHHLMLGANLLADMQKANFLDIRMTFSFYKN